MQVDVVLGHTNLLRDLCSFVSCYYLRYSGPLLLTNNLNLDVDLNQLLRERVDLDETRVDSASKTTEFGDETNITLRDRSVGVGADDTARNSSKVTNDGTKGVDHASVPSMLGVVFGVGLDNRGVGRLQVLTARRLDLDERVVVAVATADRRLAQVRVLVADLFVVHCGKWV